MSNIKLDVEVERKTLMTKRPPRLDATRIGSKKKNFQLELRNRFETLQELDDIDTMMVSISDMIQQSASRVPKAINKPRNVNRGYHHQHEHWRRNDEKWQKTATINNEQNTQKYARPSKRKQERTSGNTTKRSYEKQLWHQRA